MNNALLDESAAAQLLGISKQTLYKWSRRGKFPVSILPNGRRYYESTMVQAFVPPPRTAHNKLSQKEFLDRCRREHKDLYSYDQVEYDGYESKIRVGCSFHGYFSIRAADHLNGHGCWTCAHKANGDRCRHSISQFVDSANQLHGNKYDYSRVAYTNNRTKVELICPSHGSFWVSPDNHIHRKSGCRKCVSDSRENSLQKFLDKAAAVHGDLYDYSQVTDGRSMGKASIICRKHGPFIQTLGQHMLGAGCPRCLRKREAALEALLRQTFSTYEIIAQKRITSDLYPKGKRTFDFWIQDAGVPIAVVEYDGIQHFHPVRFSTKMSQTSADHKFIDQKKVDAIDKEYCNNEGICLVRIRYNDSQEQISSRLSCLSPAT